MKFIYEWIKHFFWLIGWIVKEIVEGDFKNAYDTYFWLKIHFMCKLERVSSNNLTLNQKIFNFLIRCIGFAVLLLLFSYLYMLIKLMMESIN